MFPSRVISVGLLLALVCVPLGGCVSVAEFSCGVDADCGAGGSCELGDVCAFTDAACESGLRFGERSGASSGDCVDYSDLPTATFTEGGLGAVVDTSLRANARTTNFGNDQFLGCQAAPAFVSLYRFDVSALGAGATVASARLELFISASVSQPRDFNVHAVLEAWDDATATHERRLQMEPWSDPGCGPTGSRGAEIIGSVTTDVSNPHLENIALSRLTVQKWIDEPAMNFGVVTVCPDAGVSESFTAASSESGAGSRPVLSVTYRAPM